MATIESTHKLVLTNDELLALKELIGKSTKTHMDKININCERQQLLCDIWSTLENNFD